MVGRKQRGWHSPKYAPHICHHQFDAMPVTQLIWQQLIPHGSVAKDLHLQRLGGSGIGPGLGISEGVRKYSRMEARSSGLKFYSFSTLLSMEPDNDERELEFEDESDPDSEDQVEEGDENSATEKQSSPLESDQESSNEEIMTTLLGKIKHKSH